MSEFDISIAGHEPHSDGSAAPDHKPESSEFSSSSTFAFNVWPPTQKTRDAVVSRLIETLSSDSVLSKRYGTIPKDEASEIALRIEKEAFEASGSGNPPASEDIDSGIEILQLYSREISKRMLETVKLRAETVKVRKEDDFDAGKVASKEEVADD